MFSVLVSGLNLKETVFVNRFNTNYDVKYSSKYKSSLKWGW